MQIPGYQNLQLRCEGSRCRIYGAQRCADGAPMILKLLREPYPSPQEVARFRREYDITRRFNSPGIIRCDELIQAGSQFAIALEDFGGQSLDQWPRPPLPQALSLMIRMVEGLDQVHRNQVIHRDINPSNLVWNPETDALKLIDFGIASQLSRETPSLRDITTLEGTLPYISPEQTGRMNRSVDYRSDFYSLGVTFYWLLTGELPFPLSDPLELVHAHIARVPPSPCQIRPDIPQPLAAIVLKLMAKSADDRYQSAYGLLQDLRSCDRNLKEEGSIAPFDLGRQDFSERLNIPQTLYGREREYRQLMVAFERCCQGQIELVMVTGYSGIGKTSLVNEIHRPVTQARGEFIAGKYDQFSQGEPYGPLVTAFSQLIQRLLCRSDTEICQYRQRLLEAVGSNGPLLLEVIPEFEQMIGPRPSSVTQDTDTETRLHVLFRRVLKALATAEHPLVLFIDDLQWADAAFVRLLKRLATDPEGGYLLLLGTYRSNEVHAAHPLMLSLKEIRQAGQSITTLTLAPLDWPQTQKFLGDTLHLPADQISPLTDLCFKRTQGNPFFLNQLLESFYNREWLFFHSQQRRWVWDIQTLQTQGVTENVVSFLIERMGELPETTVATLRWAAVVGNSFDLASVTVISELSPAQVVAHLQAALQRELIVAVDDSLDLAVNYDFQADPDYSPCYRFLHDRVQQAAYSLLNPADRMQAHYHLGQYLWGSSDQALEDEQLFAIVYHLNQAQAHLTSTEEMRLAALNLQAGIKARQAAGFQVALELLLTGVQLLPADAWQRDYDLTLALYSEAAGAAYLANDLTTMEQLNQVLLEHVRHPLDAVPAHETAINALIGQNQLNTAIDYTLGTLKQDWGQNLPSHPNSLQVLGQYLWTKLALLGKTPTQLVALPDMTDRAMLVSMNLRRVLMSAAYYARPNLLPVLALTMVRSSLVRGIGPASPLAFAVLGLVQCSLGDEPGGYGMGQTALELIPRVDDALLRNRAWHVFNAHLRFWREPYGYSQAGLREVYKQGLECGDLEYATFGAMMSCAISFYHGNPLGELKQEMSAFSTTITDLGQGTSLYTHEIHRQAVFNLMGDCEDPNRLVGSAYNEDLAVPIHQKESDVSNLFTYYCAKALLLLILGDYGQAAAAANINRQYLSGGVATVFVPNYFAYDALIQAQVCDQQPAHRSKLLRRIRKNRKKVARWAAMAPMNHVHHLALIDAEIARLQQRPHEALNYYEQAITAAQQNRFSQVEALASELAGRFLESRGQGKLSRTFLQDAYYLYQQWGAQAKVARLEQHYPELRQQSSGKTATRLGMSTETTTSNTSNSQLDFESVIRSSQVLSNEIVLERLLCTLMKTVLATAGAETGLLLVEQRGEWQVVAADSDTAPSPVLATAETPEGVALPFSQAMVNYVAKTGESLVLNDATQTGLFTDDPYVQSHQPKSVLCSPLLTQGQLKGILYLENNLATGAFTPERVEVLQILSGQAAISLQNARLYTDLEQARDQLADYSRTLEQKVEERTRELSQTLEVLKATQAELRFENDLLRSAEAPSSFTYQVGGSLPMDAPTYVVRSADRYLYKGLQQGQFCYVLNSRQMGKSSLMVRMLQQLQQEGYRCTAIDLTLLGSETVTPEQWYKGLAVQLWQGFDLLGRVNLKKWWNDRLDISPVQRLGQFMEQVLMDVGETETTRLVVFLDEIDSVLGLPFPVNDFFGLIRACYNQRSLDSRWRGLTFGLFGVATPAALITDSQRTPFNIGQAIPLEGFKEHEAQPLLNGLADQVRNPQTLLKALLYWTNGQPFLTQKLCQMIRAVADSIPANQEAAWIEQLVQTRVIEDWEAQDEPEHLRTICDRILNGPRPPADLLRCYQTILSGEGNVSDSSNTEELLLSGLVIKRQGQFQVNNRIYATIFNQRWIESTLESLSMRL